MVSVGYFKAQRRFFGKQFRPADIAFVARQLGIDADQVDLKLMISKHLPGIRALSLATLE